MSRSATRTRTSASESGIESRERRGAIGAPQASGAERGEGPHATQGLNMALVEDVNRAITEAMKAKDSQRLVALRMLKAAFMNREVERGRALDENEARQVVSALVKQRRDSIEQFTKGGRTGSRRQGDGGNRRSGKLPAACHRHGRARARRRRRDRVDRRHVRKRHGQGDEGGHGGAGWKNRRRQGGERAGAPQTWISRERVGGPPRSATSSSSVRPASSASRR